MINFPANDSNNDGPAKLRPITPQPIHFNSSEYIPYIPVEPDYDILVARVDSENYPIQTPTND